MAESKLANAIKLWKQKLTSYNVINVVLCVEYVRLGCILLSDFVVTSLFICLLQGMKYFTWSCLIYTKSLFIMLLCKSNFVSFGICNWICEKGSYMCNYKYLEIQFWNIQFNISREWLELPARVSPQIYSYSK